MASLKLRISSPLEAGRSILDSHSLPGHLKEALEYTSKRLARKNIHVTLIVVRKEYQLNSSVPPTPTSPPVSAGLNSPAAIASPSLASQLRFTAASPMAGLRSLVRRNTNQSIASVTSETSSPTFSPYTTSSVASSVVNGEMSSPRYWPPTPGSSMPCTPRTPHTPASMMTMSSSKSSNMVAGNGTSPTLGQNEFGMRLVYTSPLPYKDDKAVRTTIEKAERKYRLGTGWLPPPTSATVCGLNADLIRSSIIQNEILFCSEGLTLLGLDRLYTFKSALAAYARATTCSDKAATQARIEETVDELRRLVLASNGARGLGQGRLRQLPRSDLHRSYDWIRVSPSALAEVERMYKRAYGGSDQTGAFEPSPAEEQEMKETEIAMRKNMVKIGTPPPGRATPLGRTTPALKINTIDLAKTTSPKPPRDQTSPILLQPQASPQLVRPQPSKPQLVITTSPKPASPMQATYVQPQISPRVQTGKTPKLTLQTAQAIEIKVENVTPIEDGSDDSESQPGDRTARPFHGMAFWSNIDELLSPVDGNDGNRKSWKSERLGPMTPNGYDDISPVTRGEWGFLFGRDGTYKEDRTAAVETW